MYICMYTHTYIVNSNINKLNIYLHMTYYFFFLFVFVNFDVFDDKALLVTSFCNLTKFKFFHHPKFHAVRMYLDGISPAFVCDNGNHQHVEKDRQYK